MSTNTRKRKRNNSNNKADSPTKKPRPIRQTYLECDSVISSLEFHPSTHTFAASCFNGKINLYQIDELRSTTFSHSLNHPNYNENSINTQSLKELIKNNEAKMQRLKELQNKNEINFDDVEQVINKNKNDYDNDDDEDDDIENESISPINSDALSSISISSKDNNYCSKTVSCKQSMFNFDGSIIFGAWNDSMIAMYDYKTSKLIHSFNNNEFDIDNMDNSIISKLSTMKVYNHKIIITGDIDGIIRCWDIRMNLNKNNKSQRQYQYISKEKSSKEYKNDIKISRLHKLSEHKDGINCFESVPSKHRLFAGSGDGQLSVWDLRKSSDLNIIKAEMDRKKAAKQRKRNKNGNKNRNELYDIFGNEEEEEIKPKTLKAISDGMGDEILSLCLMKFDKKLCCGMTSGNMNIFSWNEWEWFGDRVKGHSEYLNCIIKYDEDCCITGCQDGVIRLISLYPHKFIHTVGTHDLNPIDHIAMSFDKGFVISFASGNKRAMTNYNRTNRISLKKNHKFNKDCNEIIKIWDMNWHPMIIYNEKQKKKKRKYNKKRHLNLCNLPKGIKRFLELSDDDFSFSAFDEESDDDDDGDDGDKKKKIMDKKKVIDDYEFSDDSLNEYSDDNKDEKDINIDDDDEDSDIDTNDIIFDDFDDNENRVDMSRRIRYKKFEDREHWIKSLAYRKKIRSIGKHDVQQHNNRKFFRDLCL